MRRRRAVLAPPASQGRQAAGDDRPLHHGGQLGGHRPGSGQGALCFPPVGFLRGDPAQVDAHDVEVQVRPANVRANGPTQLHDAGDEVRDGGVLQWAGDGPAPGGGPEPAAHASCRCWLSFASGERSNGNDTFTTRFERELPGTHG